MRNGAIGVGVRRVRIIGYVGGVGGYRIGVGG